MTEVVEAAQSNDRRSTLEIRQEILIAVEDHRGSYSDCRNGGDYDNHVAQTARTYHNSSHIHFLQMYVH